MTVIDPRLQREPEQSPDNEDREQTSLVKLLVNESPSKKQMIAELFPKNGKKEYQEISEDFKNIVKE